MDQTDAITGRGRGDHNGRQRETGGIFMDVYSLAGEMEERQGFARCVRT